MSTERGYNFKFDYELFFEYVNENFEHARIEAKDYVEELTVFEYRREVSQIKELKLLELHYRDNNPMLTITEDEMIYLYNGY